MTEEPRYKAIERYSVWFMNPLDNIYDFGVFEKPAELVEKKRKSFWKKIYNRLKELYLNVVHERSKNDTYYIIEKHNNERKKNL